MILGIIRGSKKENILQIIELAFKNGIDHLEITLNTPQALEQIKLVSKRFKVGAGTVLNVKQAKAAIKAGAKFIVSPIIDEATIKYCKNNKIPIYPGAATPNEVYRAWQLEATMVKVFPVKCLGGVDYIKELRGPFDNIKLLACGGVNPQNINDYYRAGVDMVAVGNSIFNKELMDAGDFTAISKRVREIVEAIR